MHRYRPDTSRTWAARTNMHYGACGHVQNVGPLQSLYGHETSREQHRGGGTRLNVDYSFTVHAQVSDNMHENMIKSTRLWLSSIKQMFHAFRRTQKSCKIPKTFWFLLKTRTTSGFFPCMFCCLAHFGPSCNFRHLNRKTFPSISTIFQVPPTPANYPI